MKKYYIYILLKIVVYPMEEQTLEGYHESNRNNCM